MKKHLVALAIISSLSLSTVSVANEVTESSSPRSGKSEMVGFGTGAAIGAIVGGPVGAFIGGFTGTWIGKSVADEQELAAQTQQLHQQQDEIEVLAKRSEQLESLTQQHARVNSQLEQLKMAQQQKLEELAIGLNVQFKTGSSLIEPHFKQQLDDVVYAMSLAPDLKLDLTGYADRQGDSSYNQALSEQRLAEVRAYLVNQGIAESRLYSQAFGDTAPLQAEANLENNFFDRRVTLKLMSERGMLAAQ
ncbi:MULTISPECIES: sortase-associated OmpA-like protein PdsO [unclassified Agarivorans]|uniref:sortase-associated OmpA-like protein PdsO n=1 Tax=unclassified Agarivorans TaxID=2636026 RepID=UPI0026E482A6|nr:MULTISPECIES: sortase-associated OmpA-like protein PdsO [unclassified Agarivorans]MDO6684809.1 sortase-associated OmpA-like protein PdsO [Agarivorans sp. 3_MG-2023]MDO6715030.1 sortase-associated OmpA-like protein PdsO [Agarivorans sp. 2_MG-2023]